jgi:hypothetical protein
VVTHNAYLHFGLQPPAAAGMRELEQLPQQPGLSGDLFE